MKKEISLKRLKEVLHYDLKTGIFTWKKTLSRRRIAGKEAGNLARGYIEIGIDNESYLAHRLAWKYIYGYDPDLFIDHIDGDRKNNRIFNLRVVSSQGNQQNITKAQRNNKIGVLGVSNHGKTGLFRSRIMVDRKVLELGYFNTIEDAHLAYLTAKRKLHLTCTI